MEKTTSFLLSFSLHIMVFIMILFWPMGYEEMPREVYQVSLVMGDIGGEGLASSVLGARAQELPNMPEATPDIVTTAQNAPENVPPPAANIAPDTSVEIPKPETLPDPVPQPESQPVPIPVPEPPKDVVIPEVPKPKDPEPEPEKPKDPPKPDIKPEPEKPKDPPKPPTPKPTQSATASALADLNANQNQNKPPKSSATASALADLQGQAGGVGGGGGTGAGPGGGGIYDVYMGQVMGIVQKNWSMPTYSRENYVVQIFVRVDATGKILDTRIEKSSGRADFDASAMNTLIRIGSLPPPPNTDLHTFTLSFNSQQ